jgi:hypothetical protein
MDRILDYLTGEGLVEFKDIGLIALAAILAGAVGLERESGGKPAGFRTHMIINGIFGKLQEHKLE